jgi:hypothetical protein
MKYIVKKHWRFILQTIAEKIKQRRRQMLVHSYLYYEKDVNIVSDSKWSQWAMELVQLQQSNPDVAKTVEYAELFEDWDGSSGVFLKYDDAIKATADRLYALRDKQIEKPKQPQKKKTVSRRLF